MRLEQDINFIEKRLIEQCNEMHSILDRYETQEITYDRMKKIYNSAQNQYNYFIKLKEKQLCGQQ